MTTSIGVMPVARASAPVQASNGTGVFCAAVVIVAVLSTAVVPRLVSKFVVVKSNDVDTPVVALILRRHNVGEVTVRSETERSSVALLGGTPWLSSRRT
ncbi:hypothetical protein ACFQ0H_26435 [Lysobacter gummosus]|uniref:hypothetical protein n=1 Tax=Lysobacter gummosus TaxID=262324 RepID=UPI00363F8C93